MALVESSRPPAQITLVGLPTDVNSSYLRGAAGAPAKIRAALNSESANLWTEGGIDLGADGVLADAGDLDLGPDGANLDAIESGVSELLETGTRVLSMGGDHAVAHPLVRAHRSRHPRLSILHFDAHPDLYENFQDNPRSHASPFARILEEGLVQRLVQVGIRTLNRHQREQAERYGVEVIEMRDWERALTLRFDEPVYLTFDLDVLDPAFAPGISHPEPGGASTRQALDVIHGVEAQVIGGDVVELNPLRDVQDAAAMTAARVLREIAGKILTSS